MASGPRMAALILALPALTGELVAQTPLPAPWDSVGRVLQTSGVLTGGYYRYNFPRRDLTVRIGEVAVAPGLALGSWAGFDGPTGNTVIMGDLVLTGSELKPVLAELARQRIDVTAIHNHLVGEQPTITYVHYHASGRAVELAARLDQVLKLTATPRPVNPPDPIVITIDTAAVFRVLGRSGTARGDIAQVSFILVPGTVTMDGHTVNPALGYGSPINIRAVSPSRAVATGDFAVLGQKVSPLLTALAMHGITATAVHSHLVDESPRVYYIHFWADGSLAEVLAGLKAAVDSTR